MAARVIIGLGRRYLPIRQGVSNVSASTESRCSAPAVLRENIMKKITTAVLGAALVALSFASAASASERHHVRRAVQQPTVSGATDPRNAFDSYGGLDARQSRAAAYGVQPGLVYGGTTSAPAGR